MCNIHWPNSRLMCAFSVIGKPLNTETSLTQFGPSQGHYFLLLKSSSILGARSLAVNASSRTTQKPPLKFSKCGVLLMTRLLHTSIATPTPRGFVSARIPHVSVVGLLRAPAFSSVRDVAMYGTVRESARAREFSRLLLFSLLSDCLPPCLSDWRTHKPYCRTRAHSTVG